LTLETAFPYFVISRILPNDQISYGLGFFGPHTMSQKSQVIGSLVIWQNAGNYKK
jgi:hypothetical protein